MAVGKKPSKALADSLKAAGIKPGEAFVLKVVKGCDTADGKRYEIGQTYEFDKHSEETTAELLDAGAIE